MQQPVITYPNPEVKIGERYFSYFGSGFPEGFAEQRGEKIVYHTNELRGSSRIVLCASDADFVRSLELFFPEKDFTKIKDANTAYRASICHYFTERYSKSKVMIAVPTALVLLATGVSIFATTPLLSVTVFVVLSVASIIGVSCIDVDTLSSVRIAKHEVDGALKKLQKGAEDFTEGEPNISIFKGQHNFQC